MSERHARKAVRQTAPGAGAPTHQRSARATPRADAHRATRGAAKSRVRTKRVYEPAERGDGTRVLIMRLWPRGIRKERVDLWLKELGPAVPLLRAFLDKRVLWATYRRRYLAGLRRPAAQAALRELRALARKRTVTLLCGCANPARCHRTLLARRLARYAARVRRTNGTRRR